MVVVVRRLRARRARSDRGAAAVEFAIVMVPMLLLVFGIISYGYMLAFRQSISQAVAEGARAAAVAPAGTLEDELRDRVEVAINGSLESYDVACDAGRGTLSRVEAGDEGEEETEVPAGTCEVTGPRACPPPVEKVQCVRIELDYTYSDDSLLPDVGYRYVLPDHLVFAAEVQVS